MDGRKDGFIEGWMDGRMGRNIDRQARSNICPRNIAILTYCKKGKNKSDN
jgi:hypothetical protein